MYIDYITEPLQYNCSWQFYKTEFILVPKLF